MYLIIIYILSQHDNHFILYRYHLFINLLLKYFLINLLQLFNFD